MSQDQLENSERQAINASLKKIGQFVQTDAFQSLLQDLYREPVTDRSEFVDKVILDDEKLAQRGVTVPDGLLIQRSAFKDGRPTLFCVTEKMPKENLWKKATFTFDNEISGAEAS